MSEKRSNRAGVLLAVAVGLAAASLLPHGLGEYWVRLMNAALISSAAVLGLNFVLGYTGQISMMHAAVAGLGAYGVAVSTVKYGLSPWVGCLLGIVAAGAFSHLLGILLLRLKGHYFALATLGVNVSFIIVVSNLGDVTGGSNGLTGIPPLSIAGFALDSERRFFYLALLVALLLTALAWYVRHSQLGRSMIAARDDELAASVSGLNVTAVKVTALTLGGVYAGIAGVMFALHARFVAPEDFNISTSILYLAMLVVGGEATILGSILGAFVLTFLPEWLRWLGSAYLVIFGMLVLLMLFLAPRGVAGVFDGLRGKWTGQLTWKEARKWRFSK
jgi:branched-chain amino acid transport system permease protein